MTEENLDISSSWSEPQGFSVMWSQQADISEYQEVSRAQDEVRTWMSLEDRLISLHAISKIVLGVVIVLCLVLVLDGFAQMSSSGNALTRLPFFQQGNFFCNRTNGNAEVDYVLQDKEFLAAHGYQDFVARYDSGVCFSRTELTELYEDYKKHHETNIAQTLQDVLPRKFTYVSFSESPLFRFVQSKSPDRRIQPAEVIEKVLSLVDKVDSRGNTQLICQKIAFDHKIVRVSCIARGRDTISSRDVVLEFLDTLKSSPSLLVVNHPRSIELRQLDQEEYETETIFDVQVVQRSSEYEVEVLSEME